MPPRPGRAVAAPRAVPARDSRPHPHLDARPFPRARESRLTARHQAGTATGSSAHVHNLHAGERRAATLPVQLLGVNGRSTIASPAAARVWPPVLRRAATGITEEP